MSFETASLSTVDLPDGGRDEMIREFYGKIAQRMELSPIGEGRADIEVTSILLPGLMLGGGAISPMTGTRTKAMRTDGASDFIFSFVRQAALIRDRDVETTVQPGDLLVTALDRPFSLTMREPQNSFLTVQASRRALAQFMLDIDDLATGSLSIDRPGLRLLETYVARLEADQLASAPMRDLVARQVLELIALAAGSKVEAAQSAGGLRAARLAAAKDFVTRSLDSALSAADVAAQLGVSPRYLHMLFDGEPLSFAEFVSEQRLARACAMLADPARRHWRILDIAFEAGFGDIGAFNRVFRRRRGMTPTEFRRDAQPH